MPEVVISNEDIRGIVRGAIFDFITNPPCKKCEFWDRGGHYCFLIDSRRCKLLDQILSIPNLAVVDRDAQPPIRFIHPDDSGVLSYEKCKQDMTKAGWVKEIK